MGVHQMVYETRMRYSDPDAYKAMMKAKAAHENGDSNAVASDTSYKGRGASGGLENLGVQHYSMNDPAPTPAPASAPAPSVATATAPVPVVKPKEPIKYSPEIQQAKERVNKYQSDILSGKVSEDIYSKDTYIADSILDKNKTYDFSLNAFGNDR